MVKFEVKMQHSEESLEALSRMQYDLFCTSNRVVRTLLSAAFVVLGLIFAPSWLAYLSIAYGCFLITSTYASANHTARKLSKQLKDANMPFPCSKYFFEDEAMQVVSLPDGEKLDPLPYSKVYQLAEDMNYFYIFRDQYGGYMIPKSQLTDCEAAFCSFMESKTGKFFRRRRQTPIRRLRQWIKQRENEAYHL